MKLVTYRRSDGSLAHGSLDGDTITEIGESDLSAIVAGGPTGTGPSVPLADVTLVAPIQQPGAIYCAAANYEGHIKEGGGVPTDKSRLSPRIFLKPPTCVADPDEPFVLPTISKTPDWETELVAVIGREASNVSPEEGLDYVFGYCIGNDMSLRSLDLGYERDESPWVGFFDWLEGKWAPGGAPIGPWLVTADEVGDPQALRISMTLNGETKQDASTGDMIFTVAELVSFCSSLAVLKPGDLIMTGTPAGVGAASGRYLTSGDEMVLTIEKLGSLRTPVA